MTAEPPRPRLFAGDRVRTLRARLALSQTALSQRLGISTSYLSQIESGDRPITGGVLAALARAFAIEPALLLLDEPFVSLDEATANRLRALLMEVWSARPTTALMVTHNLREAVQLSDRIVFLTERPSRVRGVEVFDRERSARDTDWRERTVRDLDRRYSGVL